MLTVNIISCRLENYEKSFELSPDNNNAKQVLKNLKETK